MRYFKLVLCFVFFVFISCKNDVKSEDFKFLNGYWEITKVEMPDGEKKEFKVNETIDFIQYSNLKGSRNKVVPQLDGKILSNKLFENFTVNLTDEIYYLNYKTDFADWKEELLKINENELIVKNSNDLIYYYAKRTDLKH